jgi:hypothetical protein
MMLLAKVRLTIYKVTGNQLFFKVPPRVCEECDILVNVTTRVVNEINDNRVTVEVKPWLSSLRSSLKRGGWHPPVLLINGQLFSQGTVPNAKDLEQEIIQELTK